MDQLPLPPRSNGFTLRYHPIVSRFSALHSVDLLVLPGVGDEPREWKQALPDVREVRFLPSVHLSSARRHARRVRFWLRYLGPGSDPTFCHSHEGPELECAIGEALSGCQYEVVVLASWRHATIARRVRSLVRCRRLVVDLIDSPALLMQRGTFEECKGPYRWRETERLRRLERELASLADRLLYVSRVDADYANPGAPGVRVVPNGVAEEFDADAPGPVFTHWSMGFLGSMSYPPNVRAAEWLAKRALPRVREQHPDATLVVVGRNPDASVRRLAGIPGVTVTGTVPNVRDYLASMQVCAFPMFSGAGLQNKVLEAMLAGRPVVTTSIGNEGIDAKPGSEVLVADDEEGFARAVQRLLEDPREALRIGENGRAFVRAHFTWDAVLRSYEAALFDASTAVS